MRLLVEWEIGEHVLRAWVLSPGNQEMRRKCYHLRYEQYHDVKHQIPDSPDSLDIDWAEEHSTLMCSTLDDDFENPIGTFRHIHCEHGCLLTHGRHGSPEVFSGVPFEMAKVNPRTGAPVLLEQTVEGSRCVAHAIQVAAGDGWMTPQNGLEPGDLIVHSMLLFEASLELCRQTGVKQWVCAIHDAHVKNCIRDGWDFIEIIRNPDGAPHLYKGEEFRVCVLPIPPSKEQDYFCRRVLKRGARTW